MFYRILLLLSLTTLLSLPSFAQLPVPGTSKCIQEQEAFNIAAAFRDDAGILLQHAKMALELAQGIYDAQKTDVNAAALATAQASLTAAQITFAKAQVDYEIAEDALNKCLDNNL